MKTFGKIESRFWESPDIYPLSQDAKMLALYLLTCKHGNMVGVFRLPPGYIMGDLGWDAETVSRGLHELVTNRFITRHEESGYLCINRFIQYNDTSNVDQLRARIKVLKTLPEQVPDITHIFDALALKASVYKESAELLVELNQVRKKFVGSSSEVRLENKRNREIENKRSNTHDRSADRPRKKPKKNPDPDDFEHWWQQYPRRYNSDYGKKEDARRRYRKYIREKQFTAEELLEALMRYQRFCDTPDEEGRILTGSRFVKQATTFLNNPDNITNQWTVNYEACERTDPIAEAERENEAIINGEYPTAESEPPSCGGHVYDHDWVVGGEVDHAVWQNRPQRTVAEISEEPPPTADPVGFNSD